MMQIKTDLYSIRGIVKCKKCGRKIVAGEKYVQIFPNENMVTYINLCHLCTKPFSVQVEKAGDDISEYNNMVMALPEAERKLKFKMARKICNSNQDGK